MTKKQYKEMVSNGEIQILNHEQAKIYKTVNNRLRYSFSVDKNLRDIIQVLNDKGYETFMSCEGNVNDLYFDLFIIFNKEYNFNIPIPDKFEMQYLRSFNKNCRLSLNDMEDKKFLDSYPNIEYRTELKEYGLNSLKEWVERLENISV